MIVEHSHRILLGPNIPFNKYQKYIKGNMTYNVLGDIFQQKCNLYSSTLTVWFIIYYFFTIQLKHRGTCVWKIQHEGVCQEIYIAQGEAECCMILKTRARVLYFSYTSIDGALSDTSILKKLGISNQSRDDSRFIKKY